MWRCRRNIDALSDRCIALWKPTNLELEVGRIRTGASYDVVSNIIPSSEQWEIIDKRGGVSTCDEQRNRIRGFLVDYANELEQQTSAPTFSMVSDILQRVEVATKDLLEALDNLDKPSAADANAVRRMESGLTREQTDNIARKAVSSASKEIHAAIRRFAGATGASLDDYGTTSAQTWRMRLYDDCRIWNAAARAAVERLGERHGDPSPTRDWAMRRLLGRLKQEYLSAGCLSPHSDKTLFGPWVNALLGLLSNPPSRNAIALAIKRWLADR
jgi:hypothetical protein